MIHKSVVLFNPRSADSKHRIPNSILQVGGSIEGLCDYYFVDGNLEQNPLDRIIELVEEHAVGYVGMTVMPGPQLRQAIPYVKAIKRTISAYYYDLGRLFCRESIPGGAQFGLCGLCDQRPGRRSISQLAQIPGKSKLHCH